MTTEHRQRQGADALRFIRSFIEMHGWPPSRSEIAAHLNLRSTSDAQKVIQGLVDDGLIQIGRGVPRGIKVNAVDRPEAL